MRTIITLTVICVASLAGTSPERGNNALDEAVRASGADSIEKLQIARSPAPPRGRSELHGDRSLATRDVKRYTALIDYGAGSMRQELVSEMATTMPREAVRTAKAILLIRVLVGWVFLSEGIQKFLFPETLGVGRFVKIGIPWPQVMAPFVGAVEIVCGTLLLIGLLTRLAAIPLLIDICVALYSTKIVMLARSGIWSTLHEARTDVSMLLGLIVLLLIGGGTLSIDARFSSKTRSS